MRGGILQASYTDRGRGAAGPLSGKATVKLRGRRLEAEFADEKKGPKVLGNFLGAIDHGHYARFDKLNLSDSKSVTFRVASAGQGGNIEVRADSASGELLAAVEVKPTGSWDKWIELNTPVKATTNRIDVFVVFASPGKGGLMNLDWIQFNP